MEMISDDAESVVIEPFPYAFAKVIFYLNQKKAPLDAFL